MQFCTLGIIILVLVSCAKPKEQFKHRRESKEELAFDDRDPRLFSIITDYVFYDNTTVRHTLTYVEGYPEYYPLDEVTFDKEERTVPVKRIDVSKSDEKAIIRQFLKALDLQNTYGRYSCETENPRQKVIEDLKIILNPDKYFKNFELTKNQRYEGVVLNDYGNGEVTKEKVIIENLGNITSFDFCSKMRSIQDADKQGYWVESTDGSGFRMWLSSPLYCKYLIFGSNLSKHPDKARK